MSFLPSILALSLGVFVTLSPSRAVRIWGWRHFDELSPRGKTRYLLAFRVMGLTIGLAGVLLAVDRAWFH